MRAADRFHSPAPEELMEYVDGEGTADARAAIESHLANCAACQALIADQRRLTGRLQAWQVAAPPASLQAPAAPATGVRRYPPRTIAAGLTAAAAVLVLVAINQRPRPLSSPAAQTMQIALQDEARPPAAEPGRATIAGNAQVSTGGARALRESVVAVPAPAVAQSAPRTPSVIRTASLQMIAKDFSGLRASVESIMTSATGFIDRLTVTGDTSRARVLRGTLRVPGDRLGDTLTRLRALGQVVEDTQGSQDVTDQIVDLDARLASARATEQRLTDVLRNRTGRLSDVLEVERELARVRLDIERLDAEKTNMTRRVTYATVDLTVTEERKETIAGPLSITTRLKVAALDGIEAALDSVAAVALFLLRAGPTLAFWGGTAALAWLAFRRIRDRSAIPDPR